MDSIHEELPTISFFLLFFLFIRTTIFNHDFEEMDRKLKSKYVGVFSLFDQLNIH